MAPEYRFRPKARSDLESIRSFSLRTWGPHLTRAYLARIRDTCIVLARQPNLGRARDELVRGLRVYPGGRHLIFYFPTQYGIDIVRILHERSDSASKLP